MSVPRRFCRSELAYPLLCRGLLLIPHAGWSQLIANTAAVWYACVTTWLLRDPSKISSC